ncbi:hypothetical protein AKJ09_04663 [Labilithrix luteola]|uniref:Uncharacterized protein n=1 Tax=Labilithrix luteola TaxID=1391654 RepID=A0A0K1PXX2_9BACT|nr:hypothetical protein [Labilithrix luteola]AKU97999.1 hypothetical protein AKJ09_04663 [Labilithrix luteola]
MKLRFALASLATLALVFGSSTASATLTSSEKGQIKDFVASARTADAGRVRSLVARTDLAPEESVAVLSEALTQLAFTEQRAVFLRELVFGGASAPSRPLVAHVVVKSLLARADAIHQKYALGLDREPRALAELTSIYAFIDGTIANAGKPTLATHDPSAGIPSATYEECSKALRDHVEHNARWLKGDAAVPDTVARTRAQAHLALFDMLPDGLTRRVDAADRLALKGARRQMLIEWGILFEDGGKLEDGKVERVRQLLAKLGSVRGEIEAIASIDDPLPLTGRGPIVQAPRDEANPFGDEVTPGTFDGPTSAISHSLAVMVAKKALDAKSDLRARAEKDVVAASGDPMRILGRPLAPSVEHVVGAAVHLLLVDAPRAVDLAFVRLLDARPESAALLSDAMGTLDGISAPVTALKLAPYGAATGFTLEGHAWSMDRTGPALAVTGASRDGKLVSLAFLSTAKTPLKEAASWSEGGLSFSKLHGTPRAGLVPASAKEGLTVKLAGTGTKGYDVIVTRAPSDDVLLEGDLTVSSAPGGIVFRAASGRDAVKGGMLLVTPSGRVAMVTTDDAGAEAPLSAPIEPPPAMPVHVRIAVKGTKVEATVGKTKLEGTLPAGLAKGDIGFVAKRGANVEFAGFSLRKP